MPEWPRQGSAGAPGVDAKGIEMRQEGEVDTTRSGVEEQHVEVAGSGVIAVLDNAQDMDPCSCDLVKVKR